MGSQITLADPRLGAEKGVGRTKKRTEHEKPTVPCLNLAADYDGPALSRGCRQDGKKKEKKQTNKQKRPPRAQH